jgi:hypothetical protein
MTRSIMSKAGVAQDRERHVSVKADGVEVYVCGLTHGRLRPRYDSIGDVDIPDGRIVDVKRVEKGFTWVNCGGNRQRRPRADLIIVVLDFETRYELAGSITPDRLRWEKPTNLPDRLTPITCWLALKRDLVPVPPGVILGPIRLCPACVDTHPAGTTCAGGWASWRALPPVLIRLPWEDD